MTEFLKMRFALAILYFATGSLCIAQTPPIFNVRTYGALGDGVNLDSPAVNAAIAAAGAAGGGTVTFPAGNYFCGSIHLTNNLTLYLSNNAVILASKTAIDPAEENVYSNYQDFGHSYFHDSLIWGENLTNLTFAGPGQINGNGNLTTQTPAAGQGDKALTLVLCDNVIITNLTITRGGHFGILANGCSNLLVSGTQILESTSRDGFNLISSSDVIITNCTITGSDDAMVLKSDYALGMKINSQNIHIINCQILSTENNALQFGSETVGDFRDVTWANIGIGGAGKAGIGITSNDGSIIDGVTYDNITMTNCACAILLKLDNQGRAPGPPPVGRIRNISINNVTAYHSTLFSRTNTATIDGYPGIPIENITFNNVNLSTIGGYPATAVTNYPVQNDNWTPDSMGLRPSFGWYVRYAKNISFTNCQVHFDSNDNRPAAVADTVTNILFSNFKADVGQNNANYDLSFLNTSAFEVTNAIATASAPSPGTALRINSSNATPALIVSPPYFSPGDGIYSSTQNVAIASSTPGATIRYTTDGTTPTPTNGTIYSAPVAIGSETILLAVAYANGLTNSAVNTAIYNLPGTSLYLAPPPTPPQTNTIFSFEAENLPYVTNGAVAVLQSDTSTSGGHWLALEASGTGQSIDYTVTNIPAGTYDIQMSWKGNSQRGIISFALDGTVLGANLDQYSSAQIYPTTDYGIVTFMNGGNHVIHLAVVGKNPAANGYWISTDRFIFTQLQAGLPQSPDINAVTMSGANLFFNGTNGIPTATYYLLASTNFALPPASWTVVATNVFDAGGNFTFSNAANANAPMQFYMLKCQLLELQ